MSNISTLNSKLVSSIDDKYPIDLAYGKMGICIYFYYLSRWEDNDEYKQIADRLLDEIIDKLSNKENMGVAYRLAGVAVGISHLVKEKFIGGDINEILEDVDSHIFKILAFLKNEESNYSNHILIYLLFYSCLRFKEQSSSDGKYIFQEFIIKIVEIFQRNLFSDFSNEHFSFYTHKYQYFTSLYVISNIYDLNIYNYRITKIIEEIIGPILSTIPVLQVNRLYLLCGLLCIMPCLQNCTREINAHIHLLKEKIDIDYLVNVELKNQDIYIKNGISLVYILLFFIQHKYPDYQFDYNLSLFYNKINSSEAWNALISREDYYNVHRGLLDGFPGAYLISLFIKKHLQ